MSRQERELFVNLGEELKQKKAILANLEEKIKTHSEEKNNNLSIKPHNPN